jgi:hypothetical protein
VTERPDGWIRWTTIVCVALLALIAGTVSYLHVHRLVALRPWARRSRPQGITWQPPQLRAGSSSPISRSAHCCRHLFNAPVAA